MLIRPKLRHFFWLFMRARAFELSKSNEILEKISFLRCILHIIDIVEISFPSVHQNISALSLILFSSFFLHAFFELFVTYLLLVPPIDFWSRPPCIILFPSILLRLLPMVMLPNQFHFHFRFALESRYTPRWTEIRSEVVGLGVRVDSLTTKTTVSMPTIGRFRTLPGTRWTPAEVTGANNNLRLEIPGFESFRF